MKIKKDILKHHLSSESGSMLLLALVGLAILSISFYTGISQLIQTQKQMRMVVIKQQMVNAEGRLNNLLQQPISYEIIPPAKVASIKQSVLDQFKISVIGSKCQNSVAFCGITLDNPHWDSATTHFSASLTYTGEEVSLRPITIDIKVPPEVVQFSMYTCDSAAPFLSGFKSNGELICKTIPQPSECSTPGSYIHNVDSGLRVQCGSFQTVIQCPSDQYISPPGPQWVNEEWTRPGCTDRIDPYANPELRPSI